MRPQSLVALYCYHQQCLTILGTINREDHKNDYLMKAVIRLFDRFVRYMSNLLSDANKKVDHILAAKFRDLGPNYKEYYYQNMIDLNSELDDKVRNMIRRKIRKKSFARLIQNCLNFVALFYRLFSCVRTRHVNFGKIVYCIKYFYIYCDGRYAIKHIYKSNIDFLINFNKKIDVRYNMINNLLSQKITTIIRGKFETYRPKEIPWTSYENNSLRMLLIKYILINIYSRNRVNIL